MKRYGLYILAAAILFMARQASAGPLDNAMEFQEKAVQEAEERSESPQSSEGDEPISWADDDKGTEKAVNTGQED